MQESPINRVPLVRLANMYLSVGQLKPQQQSEFEVLVVRDVVDHWLQQLLSDVEASGSAPKHEPPFFLFLCLTGMLGLNHLEGLVGRIHHGTQAARWEWQGGEQSLGGCRMATACN